jgi:hypothetical protein
MYTEPFTKADFKQGLKAGDVIVWHSTGDIYTESGWSQIEQTGIVRGFNYPTILLEGWKYGIHCTRFIRKSNEQAKQLELF